MRIPKPGTLLMLLAVSSFLVATSACSAPHNSELVWPLNRSGVQVVVLKLPPGYGAANQGAEEMNRLLHPEGHAADPGNVSKDMLITALWPGLEPHSSVNDKEFNRPDGGRTMFALLKSGAIDTYRDHKIDKLQSAFDVAVDDSVEHLCISPLRLGKTVDDKARCFKRTQADVKPDKFGLARVGVDFSKYPDYPEEDRAGIFQQDIYYQRDASGRLQTVILCTAEEAKTVDEGPQYYVIGHCQHKFIDKDLNALVSVNYRRIYLKEWRDVEAAWRKLLGSFVVRYQSTAIRKQ